MNIFRSLLNTIREQGWILIGIVAVLATIMAPWHVYVKDIFCLLLLIVVYSKHDKTSILIFLFSVFYTFIVLLKGSGNISECIGYVLGPLSFYFFGKRIVDNASSEENIINCFILITIGACAVLWYNNVEDIVNNGLVNLLRVIETDNQREISATLQGMVLSLGIGCLSYTICFEFKQKSKSVIMLFISLLSLSCTIHLLNRTGLIIFSLVLLVSILFVAREKKSFVFLGAILLLASYWAMIEVGILNEDVFAAYEDRNANISSGGGRTEVWLFSINQLVNNPFGWGRIVIDEYSGGYCHNLWLDVARLSGWLPFGILLYITIDKIREQFCLFRLKGDSLAGFIINYALAIQVSSFVEPVIEGVSIYFYLLCLVWGIQTSYYSKRYYI